MFLEPRAYFTNVREIKLEFLRENNIKALILDVDNTLIDFDKNLSEETIKWAKELMANGIKLYVLSNSNKKQKVKMVADKLGTQYDYFAKKPLKMGFKKVQKILQENNLRGLFAKEILKEEDDYLNFLSKNLKVVWNSDIVFFPFETSDLNAIYTNQRQVKIGFTGLSSSYMDSIMFLAEEISGKSQGEIKKAVKIIKEN